MPLLDVSKVPLFRDLKPRDQRQVAEKMEHVQFDEGITVFRQGDVGDAFYIVVEGTCLVMVRPANFIKVDDEVRTTVDLVWHGKKIPKGSVGRIDKYDPSRDYPYTVKLNSKIGNQRLRGRADGEEIELCEGAPEDKCVAKLKAGDYFGEQSLLKGTSRNATIVAATKLKLAMLDGRKFKELGTNIFGHRWTLTFFIFRIFRCRNFDFFRFFHASFGVWTLGRFAIFLSSSSF